MTEEEIKREMRLFALESIVCQHLAKLYLTESRETFDAVRRQAISGTQRPIFYGFDPALSDLLSAEFQTALDRLYGMIQSHLDLVQGRESSQTRPPQ